MAVIAGEIIFPTPFKSHCAFDTLAINYAANGGTVDFSNYSAKMQVRKAIDSPEIVTWSTDDGTITITATQIILHATQLPKVASGIYKFDILMTPPEGIQDEYFFGTMNILGTITQR